MLKAILLFSVMLLGIHSANATHIVGGELNYRCLGNDQYEISLTVFRDCFNANPAAYFDDPASIGIFDVNNNLLTSLGENGQLLIPLMNDDTLDPTLFDSCLVVPPDVCVHRTIYTVTVTLPFIAGGYQLAYQRCCRNNIILNIVAPEATGATYYNFISEESLQQCNSSAVFNEWPPNYICSNEPILFDHSATDIDGDSLVYSLCTPFNGADPDIPLPQPPNPPPYDNVVWLDPPYSLNDMIGGIPLSIDSETGLLTGTPNTIGNFVVGVCVEEYRDGVLISTSRRDFQYNIGICGEAISSFFAPEVDCDGFSVDFDNQSQDALSYLWDFGDPNTNSDISTVPNPSYVYPDTGLYVITLIAGPGQACADTSYSTVSVQIPSLFVDFDLSIIDGCVFPAEVSFDDLSFDTLSTIVAWDWQFSNGETSDEQNPVWFVTNSGTYFATLTATAENGCEVSHTASVSIDVLELGLQDTAQICIGTSVILNPGTDVTYNYNWSPGNTLDNTSSPSPVATPLNSTTYYVTVEDNEGCIYTDSVAVIVNDLVIDFADQIDFCIGDTVQLHDDTNPDLSYSFIPDNNLIDGQTGTAMAYPETTTVYYVAVFDNVSGCEYADSIRLVPIIEEELVDAYEICDQESVNINPNPNLAYEYTWTPAASLDDANAANPLASPSITTIYSLEILDVATGCISAKEVTVNVKQIPIVPEDTLYTCIGITESLNPSANPDFDYTWSPTTYLDDASIPNPNVTATIAGTITYYVTILDNQGCSNIDSLTLVSSELLLNIADELDFCIGDTIQLHTGTEANVDYVWTPDVNLIDGQTGTASAYPEQEQVYYLTAIDNITGCEYIDSVRLIPIIYEEIPDTIGICFGESSELNPNPNLGYTYTWTPSATLDDDTSPNPTATTDVTTIYTVSILDAPTGCINTQEVLLIVNPLPTVPNDSVDVCRNIGEGLSPNADPAFEYIWSPTTYLDDTTAANPIVTPDVNGDLMYIVTITNPLTQCNNIDTVHVFIPEDIIVETSDDEVSCETELNVSATSNFGETYEWFTDPTLTNSIGTGDMIDINLSLGETSTFYVLTTDEYGCTDTDEVTLASQAVNVDVPPQVTICEGNEFSIEASNLNSGDDITYIWTPDEYIVDGTGTSNPTFVINEDDILTLIVENQYGCSDTLLIPVEVLENELNIFATADPDSIYPGESSQLEVTPQNNYTYQWTMGDLLDDETIYNPLATPPETTTFDVFVEDDLGCKDTASVTVFLKTFFCDAPYIFIPNAFTPDNDGMNDIFYVRGNAVDELFMAVYNRWGEKVFETNDLNTGWNGIYKGKELAPDVYGYYLQLKCLNGDEYFTKGNVTLIR
jgi:gliding motility-associated-like protein